MNRFEIVGDHTVMDADGVEHDLFEAIERSPWVDQLCPLMPHQYAHPNRSDPLAYRVVEHMLKAAHPDTYRAYFRGDAGGSWWPTEAAIAGGFEPCRACRREPSDHAGARIRA